MLLASRSQQDALPHMKTLNSASGSQLAFNNILMLSFHYFLLQVQAWVLILVSGLHGLFSSLQVPWRAKLLIHLILETLLFKYIHQPFLWTWATTWLHIFCQVPPTLGGKLKKKEVCRKFLFTFQVPLSKATRPQLEAKWPSILENHAKRATLRSPDEPAEDKITVKVWAKTLHI